MSYLTEPDSVLWERLNRHPALRARIESLLGAVENEQGDLEKADAAEQRLIEEMRQLGNEALTAWAQTALETDAAPARREPEAVRGGKKSSIGTRPSAISRSKNRCGG